MPKTTTATATMTRETAALPHNLARRVVDERPATDRRSLRTKRLLKEAFTQLMAEQGPDSFSVGDLSERADINRATFYAHYKDMQDIRLAYEDEIIESLASLRPKIKAVTLKELLSFGLGGTPPKVTVELFDLLREHGVLLKILLGPDGDAKFQARLRDQLCSGLVRSVLHHKYTDNPNMLTEYYVSYYAAATVGLIQHWLALDMPESSGEIARIMLSVMMLRPGEPITLKGRVGK